MARFNTLARSGGALALVAALAAWMLPAPPALAQEFSPEGRYEVVDPPQPTADPKRVEVLEIFWYGCPHCNRFQPHIRAWEARKPDYVNFVRMPAIFNRIWELHARAYYAAAALGVLEKTHQALFDAIHKEGRKLTDREALARFFEEHGVPRADFDKAFDSFAVDSGIRRSRVMQARYGIRGVPAVIVNGKYRVSGSLAGSYPNMIKVIEALAEREHRALQRTMASTR